MSYPFEQTVMPQSVEFCLVPKIVVSQDLILQAEGSDLAGWLHTELRTMFDTIDRMAVEGPTQDLLDRLHSAHRTLALNGRMVSALDCGEAIPTSAATELPMSA